MASRCCRRFLKNINRMKKIPMDGQTHDSRLQQKLNTFELTLLGLGAMVGAGLYVLTGVVAKDTSGPAIVVSYIIAGVVALLAAMCYAELAGKIPRTGSAYTFIYVALGEFWAFFIGWNLMLEYVISTASMGRSMSSYIDNLCDNAISNFTIEHLMGGQVWQVPNIAEYPDLLAVGIEVFVSVFVILGVSFSSWVNIIFFSINAVVVLIIFALGIRFADISNWTDDGGFAPYGAGGIVAGAATVFYSFIGFDTIAMCNEEAKNPKRSIPLSTFMAVFFAIITYIMASMSLTLMVPYAQIDVNASFPHAFAQQGVVWARWVVAIGAISGMFTALLTSVFAMARCLYAIASDGLLFPFLATINERTKIPINAAIVSLSLSMVLTLFFSVDQLVHFLSIGTLIAYAFVSGALIVLRYQPFPPNLEDLDSELLHYPPQVTPADSAEALEKFKNIPEDIPDGDQSVNSHDDKRRLNTHLNASPMDHHTLTITGTLKDRYRTVPIIKHLARFAPGHCVVVSLFLSLICQICALAIAEHGTKYLLAGDWWAICLLVLFGLGALLCFLVIPLHHQETMSDDYFSVRFVPLVPCASIFADIVLLMRLDAAAWFRYIIWLAVGSVIYFAYGYRHSNLAEKQRQDDANGAKGSYGSMLPHRD